MAINIPQYQQRTSPETGGISANAHSDLVASPVGSALEGFGREVSKGTDALGDALQKKEDADAAVQASKIIADAHESWSQFRDSTYNAATDGAPDFTKNVMDAYHKWAGETENTITNPVGKHMLQQGLNNLRTHLYDTSAHMEAQAGVANRLNSLSDITDKYSRAVYNGQMTFEDAKLATDSAIANAGLDPVTRAKLAQNSRYAIADSYANSMAIKDPSKLRQQIETIYGNGGPDPLADIRVPTNDPSMNESTWAKRADGSAKGHGFLGMLRNKNGGVSSELSVGVNINGKEMEIPTLVPTLNKGEIDTLLSLKDGEMPPDSIVDKAVAFAKQRIADKKSVFAGPEDSPQAQSSSSASGARGIRNNNPANIQKTKTPWDGEVEGSDSRFKTFATPEAGIAAIGKNLLSYNSKGINTVSAIINKLAPPTENDTSAYVATVAKQMGVDPDQKLDLKNPAVMSALTKSIIQHENGTQPYSDHQVQSGIDAALNGSSPSMASPSPIHKDTDSALSHLPPDKILSYLSLAKQYERANEIEQERADADAKARQQALQEQTLNSMLPKLTDGSLTIREIQENPTLTFTQKEHMINGVKVYANKQDNTDPSVFIDVFNRIHSNPTDPNHISNPDDLNSYMGKGLAFADIARLRNEIAGKNEPEYKMIGEFKKMAKSQLSKASLMMQDPEGDKNYYNWEVEFNRLYAQKRKEGKAIMELLDEKSKDYLGYTIKPRTIQEAISSQANAMRGSVPTAPIEENLKRRDGETIDEWNARTNDFGKLGATFDKAVGN